MERVYHTWDKWECYRAGFYEQHPPKGMTVEDCENKYAELLSDLNEFGRVLEEVIFEWECSCEHYLTNDRMNRIAWLGQAALTYKYGIPAKFRGGYNKLTEEQKKAADYKALEYLNKWLAMYDEAPLDMEQVQSKTQMNLY